MVTVVEVLNRIARQVSIDPPDNWLTATATEHLEIRDDFMRETIDSVLERQDLPAPFAGAHTIAGDGSETYSLPADFRRLQRDPYAVYETTTTRRAAIPIPNDGAWTYLKQMGSTGAERYYRLSGYDGAWSISFYREPGASEEIIVAYMRDVWKASSTGVIGSDFTDAADLLILPRRLVEAGTVARWRERKGLDPSMKIVEFEAELERLGNDARGRRRVNFGDATGPSYPFNIPVPDFIPPS